MIAIITRIESHAPLANFVAVTTTRTIAVVNPPIALTTMALRHFG